MQPDIPESFVQTMTDVCRIFPSLTSEMRDPYEPGKPNAQRLNVWYSVIGSYSHDVILEATRLLAGSPDTQRNPEPHKIASFCRRVRSGSSEVADRDADERRKAEDAARAALHSERHEIRRRGRLVGSNAARAILRLVAACNPELRLIIYQAGNDPLERYPYLLKFIEDHQNEGFTADDMVGIRYKIQRGSDCLGRVGIVGVTDEMLAEFDSFKPALIGRYPSARVG